LSTEPAVIKLGNGRNDIVERFNTTLTISCDELRVDLNRYHALQTLRVTNFFGKIQTLNLETLAPKRTVTRLIIYHAHISQRMLEIFARIFPNLKELKIFRCFFNDDVTRVLFPSSLTKLQIDMSITSSFKNAQIITQLFEYNLRYLQKLYLNNCFAENGNDDALLANALCHCITLKELVLGDETIHRFCPMHERAFNVVKLLPSLKRLHAALGQPNISLSFMYSSLTELSLSNSLISPHQMAEISKSHHIEKLNVFIPPSGLQKMDKMYSVRTLTVSLSVDQFDEKEFVTTLSEKMPNLKIFILARTYIILHNAYTLIRNGILERCPHLTQITTCGNNQSITLQEETLSLIRRSYHEMRAFYTSYHIHSL